MKMTEKAVVEIKKILESAEKETYLRVGIAGMSCKGPAYSFSLDEEYSLEEDILMEQDGLKMVHKKVFSESLDPIVIDYAEIGDRRGFTLTNPLAVVGGCCGGSSGGGGCGSGGCNS
jgi:iron-sulfur cluster assembly accessory protein